MRARNLFTLILVTMRPDRHGKTKQVWYYRLADDPKRRKKTTGVIGKRNRWQAEAYLRKLLAEQQEQKAEMLADPTFREYAKPFFIEGSCPHIARLRKEQKSIGANHIKKSRKWLEDHIFTDPIADKLIAEIRRGDLFDFRGRLLNKLEGKRNTVDKIMSTVKTIFLEAWNRDDIPSNPAYRVGLVHKKIHHGAFTAEEIQKLFPVDGLGPWPDQETHAIFLLAATSGMRWGELRALTWRQIDLNDGTILVNRAYKAASNELGLPKWNKTRTTFLTPKAGTALRTLRKKRQVGLVFCDSRGRPHAYKWWNDGFHTAMVKAGFPQEARTERNLKPHSFRASTNTILLDQGANPVKVRAALGWTREDVQEGYTDNLTLDLSDMAATMEKAVAVQEG